MFQMKIGAKEQHGHQWRSSTPGVAKQTIIEARVINVDLARADEIHRERG